MESAAVFGFNMPVGLSANHPHHTRPAVSAGLIFSTRSISGMTRRHGIRRRVSTVRFGQVPVSFTA
jgi:hypothetical protein